MEQNSRNASYSIDQVRQWEEWDKQYVWHPFTQMQDYVKEPALIISHGEGAYLYDTQGNRYFDGNSSLWVNVHGHNRKEINAAICNQLQKIAHSTLLGPGNIPSIELAKRLIDVAPKGLTKVFYSDNGSTSVEVALKMAFQYWRQSSESGGGKTKFVTFINAYHGDTLGSVSVGGIDLFHGIFGPMLFERFAVPYPVYSKYVSKESADAIAQRSLKACEELFEKHAQEIAAIIIEPLIQGAAGQLTMAPGFLKSLRSLCDQYNILLICDEVFTGFGRTGKMFACDHEDVTPDLLCLAKGITGGYLPLAATLAAQRVYDGFLGEYSELKTFFHGHSFTGNQLGCAAALASLGIFEQDNTLQAIQPVITHLEKRLDALFEKSDHVADIRQRGMAAGVDIDPSRARGGSYPIEERMGAKLCFNLRKHGIWLRPLGNTLVIIPPLITTVEEIDVLMDAIEKEMGELPG